MAASSSRGMIGIDAPRVTPDEALELMVYHLRMAAAYYEAIPPNHAQSAAEVRRILRSDVADYVDPALPAALAFYQAMRDHYDAMDPLVREKAR